MATFRIDALGETPARLRSWLDRARKATAGRSAPVRLGLLAVLAGGVAVAACLAAWSIAPAERVLLASGRSFRQDDLDRVERALRAQNIDYKLDERRVSVAGRSADAASAIVAKLDLGPRSLDELRDGAAASSFWETPRDKEERAQRERAKVFESMIDDLPGVESSFVWISRERQRGVLRPATRTTALVRVQAEGGRELPPSTVESITSIVTAAEPGLTRQSFTVMDREGRLYRDAGNPALTALSNNRAREEDLSRRILDKLAWIKDVRVTVKLEDPPAAPQPVAVAVAVEPAPRREPEVVPAPPTMSVGLNRAMELGPDDEAPAAEAPAPAAAPPPAPLRRRGEVWVLVPRSYYYNAGLLPEGGQTSHEDHLALMTRTKALIRNAVRLVIPEADGVDWAPTEIDDLPDELTTDRAPADAAGAGRRTAREWAMAGAAGAAAAAIVALGTWVFGGRQPSRRASPGRGDLRYHRGTAGAPAPTERVLEFVRRNPETAFSVLNRWTTQGGGRS
ncbi:hypothetical protein [Paludisphaera mucosa]|uniref:Flagellar M-ring N-terminal domain-containing protein n=1 Tax=Paludisphaera mucosa TaxID=3030827 RepID=A0ABT6F4J6_9BACT|nr:hypothetical protein [Paludisphaera mucosa]MDG3002512.1 hypothetical protein [Paludisphaera mucosa]